MNPNPSAAFAVVDNVPYVNITLKGTSEFQSGPGHAGLENNSVPLLINGDGNLTVTAYEGGAGIGGAKDHDGENITIDINGGTITANGVAGVGIGGGEGGSGRNITISGSGTINAKGTFYEAALDHENTGKYNKYQAGGAGIGGGLYGNGENITINGCTINANAYNPGSVNHYGGAGIGGGCGGTAKDIFITGGHITTSTTGTNNYGASGAGIGGGCRSDLCKGEHPGETSGGTCTNIQITGNANINSKGNNKGAGIGGGAGGSCSDITINLDSEGEVIAYGTPGGAGIGGGSNGNGEKITISGSGSIKATSGGDGAGIGGGQNAEGIKINIGGAVKVEAKSSSGAGIGGGSGANGNGNGITIAIDNPNTDAPEETEKVKLNAYVVAQSSRGAGIGNGYGSSGEGNNSDEDNDSGITIKSGYIEASSTYGAGIGGGEAEISYGAPPDWSQTAIGGNGSDIKIEGGYIIAASQGGAGIGGGEYGNGSSITIDDCLTIKATSGNGAGIGGGWCGNGDNITISGGKHIEATGSAGIGGGQNVPYLSGNNGNATNIAITGDAVVIATGKGGAGIGSGYNNTGCSGGIASGITISGNANVTAIGQGGAGIGSGQGGTVNDIEISGNATVNATGYNSAGIGGGLGGSCTDITISSGEITAAGIGSGGLNTPGISGGTIILGNTKESAYPWIYTNEIEGFVESESSGDLAIVFNLEKTKGTIYGGEVRLTKKYDLGAPCIKLTVKSGAKFVTHDGNENFLTLNDGVILYLEAGAKLDKYNRMTINNGEIQHEDPSEYVPDTTSRAIKTVCYICGKEEPHNWRTEWVNDDPTYHWHECDLGNDCSVDHNKLAKCSITENSQKAGYAEHDYDFNAPTYGADGKLHYFCKDCNYEYIADIPIIKLIKADGNGDPLEGAEFGLYSDQACTKLNTSVNPNANPTGTTAIADGKAVVSFAAELYKTYYIKEINAPDDYTISNKVFKVFVDAKGNVTYGDDNSPEIPVCKNKKSGTDDEPDPVDTPTSSIKIIKVDSATKKPLAGARFGLYSDEECTEQITTGTTAIDADNNAAVSFAAERNKTYYIKETKAPNGYTASNKVFKAVVDADGKVTYGAVGSAITSEDIPVCENKKSSNTNSRPDPSYTTPGIAKIIKVDSATQLPLAGAQFGLYSDEECINLIMTRSTAIDANNDAVAYFTAERNGTYYIKETKAPDGYTASDEVFKVVVDAYGKVTYGAAGSAITSEDVPVCENKKLDTDDKSDPVDTPSSIKIIKVDSAAKTPLAGAWFSLYSDEECTKLITIRSTAIDSDNNAVVSFAAERNETYYIKETKAPSGYKVSDKVFKAVVDADGKVTYGAAGSEITSEDIPVCENEKSDLDDKPDPADTPSSSIKIIKVDSATKNPLAGARFGIYSDEECTKLITTETTEIGSDNNAVVSFAAERNKTYYIKETKAPDGYTTSDEVFKAVVDADGKVTYGAAGSEITSEDIPVCENRKSDLDDKSDPADTPSNPQTGVVLDIVRFVILNGIICIIFIVKGAQRRRKR